MNEVNEYSAGLIKPMSYRRRILFFAEAVTLAHVARPMALAKSLDPTLYEVHFACDARYYQLLGDLPFTCHPLRSISSDKFLNRLSKGSPLYSTDTLHTYVEEDLKIIRIVKPDVVIGDFRLSLAVSARLAQIPYLTITNAYWSPYAKQRFPVPDIPLTKVMGIKLAQGLFNIIRPLAFTYHTLPLNKVRRKYGLPRISLNLRQIYTYADHTLYADIPELIPTFNLPPHHHYIGPILWSPAVSPPNWWDEVPKDRPILYVTLGSSGQIHLLPTVLEALADLPVTIMAATAGRIQLNSIPKNAFIADYLPGREAAARANLVMCNGGSLTAYQALAEGKPVIGIASNLDQYLNISMIQNAGAGKLLRSGKISVSSIKQTVEMILRDPEITLKSQAFMHIIARYSATDRFESLLQNIIGE